MLSDDAIGNTDSLTFGLVEGPGAVPRELPGDVEWASVPLSTMFGGIAC